MKQTTRLRQLFERPEVFVLPGCTNAFEAQLVQWIGYEACYMSGAGTSGTLAGLPDAGLLSGSEMVMNAGYMAQAVDIPLVSDADTGYGNAVNVRRTVHAFIRAGVAGIHIEDQVAPKRCGFVAGKQVIPIDEAVGKYRAAVDARNELDEDFIIIARTDSRGAVGGTLEDAWPGRRPTGRPAPTSPTSRGCKTWTRSRRPSPRSARPSCSPSWRCTTRQPTRRWKRWASPAPSIPASPAA